jgi:membrane-anchored glycerophosphoryl diester phosphodiesterase (GDPDase)
MRRRKRSVADLFKLCGLCFMTIIINLLSTICTHHLMVAGEKAVSLENRMEVVRKVLREVPLIDG